MMSSNWLFILTSTSSNIKINVACNMIGHQIVFMAVNGRGVGAVSLNGLIYHKYDMPGVYL